MPSKPGGKIDLWLLRNERRIHYPTQFDVDEFARKWPYRFAEIHEFFTANPLIDRPAGLQTGDIIVAGTCGDALNAGVVLDMTNPDLIRQCRNCCAVATLPPFQVLKWPLWIN